MLRKLLVSAVAAVGMSVAGAATATTQTFSYVLPSGPSRMELSGSIPSLGAVSGDASVNFEIGQNGQPVDGGAATLESLIFDVDYGAAGFGGASLGLDGTVHSVLNAPVATTWSGGALAPLSGTFHVSGTITCASGQSCEFLGVPPSTTLNVDEPLSLSIEAGPAYFSATTPITVSLGSQAEAGYIILSTPEPGTLLLFGAGLASLVAAARRRRS